jgi:hypothetical protein
MAFKFDVKATFGKAADAMFAMALVDTTVFHGAARPVLLGHSDGCILKAQELVLEGLQDHLHVVQKRSDSFLKAYNSKVSYDSVRVAVAGRLTTPVGTGCGVDMNGGGLDILSAIFGFQVPGPVSLHEKRLDTAPFQDDFRRGNLFVPPTFASNGLESFLGHLRAYRERGGEAVILPSIVGLASGGCEVGESRRELKTILHDLASYSDGFVWCPSLAGSPSVVSRESFRLTGSLMAEFAPGKLNLVEMLPYEPEEQDDWLQLAGEFLDAGGDGLVAVRGIEVPRSRVPKPDHWPYETAIMCGESMGPYRQRAIEAARQAFPSAFLAACGGFHDRDEAFKACRYANVIMENEAFTRLGPGIARHLLRKLVDRLRVLERKGVVPVADLASYQRQEWQQS